VCPGTYREQVRITKDDLTLFSEVPLQAVIQAPLGMAYPNSIVSVIDATGVSIRQLKHGPLALVDRDMPVVAIAPKDALFEKLKSNLQEVRARAASCTCSPTRTRK
jgi:hypothetical protein